MSVSEILKITSILDSLGKVNLTRGSNKFVKD
jgi:hypothetical protein